MIVPQPPNESGAQPRRRRRLVGRTPRTPPAEVACYTASANCLPS